MTEKVKLPADIAADIAFIRITCKGSYEIFRLIEKSPYLCEARRRVYEWAFKNGGGSPDLLMAALVNEYEVEETPEGKILDRYNTIRERYWQLDTEKAEHRCIGYMKGIEYVLDTYGITIEGINEKEGDCS